MKSLSKATFGGHLDQLRQVVISICLILFCSLILCFTFHTKLIDWLLSPISIPLVTLSPLEGFSVSIKIAFFSALICSSPLWLYKLTSFILPALRPAEKRLLFALLVFSCTFVCCALVFAYNLTLPMALNFLARFEPNVSATCWSLAKTCDLILWLYFGHALAAMLVVTLLLLTHYRLISPLQLKQQRKKVVVVTFILAAILTPPDVMSQCLLACPLLVCYELAILYARFIAYSSR